jgi:hypothetical protein
VQFLVLTSHCFSARHNFVAALLTKPKFCNVFMGRLNSFVADSKFGSGDNVGEKATLATQRELLALRKAGRSETNLIGASVRTGAQIGDLAGVDVKTATKDGKIPVYATWKNRLASGQIGLDALMNLSARQSFVTDQTALDDRIRSMVKG